MCIHLELCVNCAPMTNARYASEYERTRVIFKTVNLRLGSVRYGLDIPGVNKLIVTKLLARSLIHAKHGKRVAVDKPNTAIRVHKCYIRWMSAIIVVPLEHVHNAFDARWLLSESL